VERRAAAGGRDARRLCPSRRLSADRHRAAAPGCSSSSRCGPARPPPAVPAIRRLVVLWIAQNVFLVASSILRTLDYIEALFAHPAAHRGVDLDGAGRARAGPDRLADAARAERGMADQRQCRRRAARAQRPCTMVDLGRSPRRGTSATRGKWGGKGACARPLLSPRLGSSALTSAGRARALRPKLPGFADRVAWVRIERAGFETSRRTRAAGRGATRTLRGGPTDAGRTQGCPCRHRPRRGPDCRDCGFRSMRQPPRTRGAPPNAAPPIQRSPARSCPSRH
jgi:hypothetical protein